jgi:hypothetical protein
MKTGSTLKQKLDQLELSAVAYLQTGNEKLFQKVQHLKEQIQLEFEQLEKERDRYKGEVAELVEELDNA